MKCDGCGQREATVHYKEIKDDRVKEMHLCQECAEERGFGGVAGPASNPQFSIPEFLGGMADSPEEREGKGEGAPAACPRCGLTYAEFKAAGRLGCSECYEALRKPLVPLLKQIHGSERHAGKMPEGPGEEHRRKQHVRMLKRRLARLVEREAYEEAARLRDEIRSLENPDE
ncbi:MAG: UvrB/UvrC motif-containing protein [Candidatus Eisenbacteria bacterium]